MYKFVKDYRDNEILRASFNRLAEETFGLNFEDWYQAGFWGDDYNPHSIVDCDTGHVVANVSVNRMEFLADGRKQLLIQLGTVMTDKAYCGQGLSRRLMEWVLEEWEGRADGVYLFANDTVLDFYPKFGFCKADEYQYVRPVKDDLCGRRIAGRNRVCARRVALETVSDWQTFAVKVSAYHTQGSFAVNNLGLLMFYATSIFKDCVYYLEELDAYVIAEVDNEALILYDIYAKGKVSPEKIAACFGKETGKQELGFTPEDSAGYDCRIYHEEDTILFVKGAGLEHFTDEKKMFPILSHA